MLFNFLHLCIEGAQSREICGTQLRFKFDCGVVFHWCIYVRASISTESIISWVYISPRIGLAFFLAAHPLRSQYILVTRTGVAARIFHYPVE